MSWTDLDPTGTLSAATSAIKLVTAISRAAPAIKNAADSFKGHSGGASAGTTAGGLRRTSTSHSGDSAPTTELVPLVDPESEKRAYETLNYVLREFGQRLCAAGLVDEHALNRALTAATRHIEVNLFSGEANRLFESLAKKLADPVLVNSVFTSIYFIGALTAELSSSLPNYKDKYGRIGPQIVQQFLRAAVGEDAFRDNHRANLNAYDTLAVTAGLLRPTDIGYATFPKFPSLTPSKYSSRSQRETRTNKNTLEKLCKHFERCGFPQPMPHRQEEVGVIRDWRFLNSDTNSRHFNVEKADMNIGSHMGRVLHWLVCSADRMTPGLAIIAYYDQHIELIKWIDRRMGFCVLYPILDLNMAGPHEQLDQRLKATFLSWVVITHSDSAAAARHAATTKWTEEREQAAKRLAVAMPPPQPAAQSPGTETIPPIQRQNSATMSRSPAQESGPQPPAKNVPTNAASPAPNVSLEQQINDINAYFNAIIKPSCSAFLQNPPADLKQRALERSRLQDLTEREVMFKLDSLQTPEGSLARSHRKAIIEQAQKMLSALDTVVANTVPAMAPSEQKIPVQSEDDDAMPSATVQFPAELSAQPAHLDSDQMTASPPPYSPAASPPAVAGDSKSSEGYPFQKKRETVTRKKPPPRPTIAKALFDHFPEEDDGQELSFKEDDELYIVEKDPALEAEGWCKARLKGTSQIGLVPLDYLEIQSKPASGTSLPTRPSNAGSASSAASPIASTSIPGMAKPPSGPPSTQPGPTHPAVPTSAVPAISPTTTPSQHSISPEPQAALPPPAVPPQIFNQAGPSQAQTAATYHPPLSGPPPGSAPPLHQPHSSHSPSVAGVLAEHVVSGAFSSHHAPEQNITIQTSAPAPAQPNPVLTASADSSTIHSPSPIHPPSGAPPAVAAHHSPTASQHSNPPQVTHGPGATSHPNPPQASQNPAAAPSTNAPSDWHTPASVPSGESSSYYFPSQPGQQPQPNGQSYAVPPTTQSYQTGQVPVQGGPSYGNPQGMPVNAMNNTTQPAIHHPNPMAHRMGKFAAETGVSIAGGAAATAVAAAIQGPQSSGTPVEFVNTGDGNSGPSNNNSSANATSSNDQQTQDPSSSFVAGNEDNLPAGFDISAFSGGFEPVVAVPDPGSATTSIDPSAFTSQPDFSSDAGTADNDVVVTQPPVATLQDDTTVTPFASAAQPPLNSLVSPFASSGAVDSSQGDFSGASPFAGIATTNTTSNAITDDTISIPQNTLTTNDGDGVDWQSTEVDDPAEDLAAIDDCIS